jgi:hypothetical protein
MVFAETIAAAKSAGIEVVALPAWYDVDDASSLDMLTAELLDDRMPGFAAMAGYPAEHTRSFLRKMKEENGRP